MTRRPRLSACGPAAAVFWSGPARPRAASIWRVSPVSTAGGGDLRDHERRRQRWRGLPDIERLRRSARAQDLHRRRPDPLPAAVGFSGAPGRGGGAADALRQSSAPSPTAATSTPASTSPWCAATFGPTSRSSCAPTPSIYPATYSARSSATPARCCAARWRSSIARAKGSSSTCGARSRASS